VTQQEPLTYVFEFPRDEQVRASRLVTHRRWGTWLGYFFFGGAGVFIVTSMLVFQWQGRYVNWVSAAPAIAGCAAMVAFIYFLPTYIVHQMRKNLPIHQGPHTWIMTPGVGLSVSSPGASAAYEWRLFREVTESPDFYLLYLTKQFACVLPKRVLGGSDAAVRQFFRAELGDRAKLK
jgi:hypothetical protein